MDKKKIRQLGIMIAEYINKTNQLKAKVQELQEIYKLQQEKIKKLEKQVKAYEQTIGKTKRITGIR